MRLVSSFLVAFLALAACVDNADYQAIVDQARSSGQPIMIVRVATSSPNSVGGVDLRVDAVNTSNKTIKYLEYDAQAFNAVGDAVRGEIRNRSIAGARETGPIPPNGRTAAGVWSNLWYNPSIRCARLTEVKIIYMDNTSKTFRGQSINSLLGPRANQPCN